MPQRKHIQLATSLAVVAALAPPSAAAVNQLDIASADATGPPQHAMSVVLETAEPSDPDALVDIPDAVLRRTLEEQLGKEEGVPITRGDMANLSSLAVEGVYQLTGLEHAINLESLTSTNRPLDSPPEELGSGLGWGLDVAPLAGLESLTSLHLFGNDISDLSPLAGLSSLTSLHLGQNAISDLTPLAGLGSLTSLYLRYNAVSDLSPLTGLGSLTSLNLAYNDVSDVAPLVMNDSLGSGDTLALEENPLSRRSIRTFRICRRAAWR